MHSPQDQVSGELSNSGDEEPLALAAPLSVGARRRGPLRKKLPPLLRWLPTYVWQRVVRKAPHGHLHLMIALADHFEPSIVPTNGRSRAPYHEQERRVETWCRDYPLVLDKWRDADGHPFKHTYFYPAEQYDKGLLDRLADHSHAGWGELEIHLHHGSEAPDTEENTRRELLVFRDKLASHHKSLSYLDGVGAPRYAFVHGNFALANTAAGYNCGVDSEIQVLAETGCYADMTLPPGRFHPANIAKINSLYECSLPLERRGAHRRGTSLRAGRFPKVFPLIVQGPLMLRFNGADGCWTLGIENSSLTSLDPPTLYRLRLWKKAAVTVKGRPDWLFIKLQCHGMDPRDRESMLGKQMKHFLAELVQGASERYETLHFVTAREMVNIILAACDGCDGDPGQYRDYRLKRVCTDPANRGSVESDTIILRS